MNAPSTAIAGAWEAARAAVARVEAEQLRHCERRRVDVAGLAKDLDIAVRTRDDLLARARWQRYRVTDAEALLRLWDPDPIFVDVIDIRADLRDSTRRFAIAHEIGHVVLHRSREDVSFTPEEHERFANAFAVELLIPRAYRDEIERDFRASTHPTDLLRLSDSLGVSPRTLLRFARAQNWLRGTDRVWLDVRCLPNRYTKRDRRPRIFDTVLDRTRWFVPRNRSIAGLLGSDSWLEASGRRVTSIVGRMDIAQRDDEGRGRFVHRSIPAHVAAVRLRRATSGGGMEVLASVELRP